MSSTSRSVSNAASSRRRLVDLGEALLERDPGVAGPSTWSRVSAVPQPDRVLALDAEARMEDPLGPRRRRW